MIFLSSVFLGSTANRRLQFCFLVICAVPFSLKGKIILCKCTIFELSSDGVLNSYSISIISLLHFKVKKEFSGYAMVVSMVLLLSDNAEIFQQRFLADENFSTFSLAGADVMDTILSDQHPNRMLGNALNRGNCFFDCNRPLAKLNRHIKITNTGKQRKAKSKTLSTTTVSF